MTSTDEVRSMLATYTDALRNNDLDGVTACFTSDAVVMAPSTPMAVGGGVRDFYRESLKASHLDITFTVEHLVESDDEAAVFTHSTGTRTQPDGTTSPVHSREAFVLTRSGQDLRIARYLFNRLG